MQKAFLDGVPDLKLHSQESRVPFDSSAVESATRMGLLAHAAGGHNLPLQVLQSAAGYYIGTFNDDGPVSRESVEYFPTREAASYALETGAWTQRRNP